MKKKTEFAKYFYELLVVFIGVTAAFLLSSWAENQKNKNLETVYRNYLVQEFYANKTMLDNVIEYSSSKVEKINRLLELVETKTFNDSINILTLNCLMKNVYYEPEKNTWESLKASGDLKLINDYKMLLLLNDLYSSYRNAEYSEKLLDDFVTGKVFDYTIENFNFKDFRFYNDRKAFTPYYSNIVIGYKSLLEGYINKLNKTMALFEKTNEYVKNIE